MQITELHIEGYERVVKAVDPESGLRAFVSIHDTTLGPSLGGLRLWNYASDDEALRDVLRLSKGMTYKSAIAQTGLGGGKSVIVGDPKKKSEALFLAMGRFVDTLGGRYITAEDVNIAVADLEVVRRATRWVTGLSREAGGSGNPSPYTAFGVFLGLSAAVERKFGGGLAGRTVAVQGVGAVGSALCHRLAEARAHLVIADRNAERALQLADELGAEVVDPDRICAADVDVFAPCALGSVINDETIGQLRCQVVAGAANNVLDDRRHGLELYERGILYAPDYVINAGGIINVSVEFREGGYDQDAALERIQRIPEALRELWTISERKGIPTSEAADRLAEDILAAGRARLRR